MRVARDDAIRAELEQLATITDDVERRRALEMAAFHDRGRDAEVAELSCRAFFICATLRHRLFPSKVSASARLGVVTAAKPSSRRYIEAASPLNNAAPDDATITGSTTNSGSLSCSARPINISMISTVASIPVLAIATGRSLITASICAATSSGESASTSLTPVVFCAVTAVNASVPKI